MKIFIGLGIVLIGIAAALVAVPLLGRRNDHEGAPIAAVIAALALPASALLLYLIVSNHDWAAPGAVGAGPAGGAQQGMPELSAAIDELAARLEENPEDYEGWMLLGRSYIQVQRYADARDAFRRALALSGGESVAAKLDYAEATLLDDQSSARGEAGELVEEALAAQPDNAKALWYGGIVAFARGDMAAGTARWREVLQRSPPPAIRQVIEEQFRALGVTADAGTATIRVRIAIDAALASRIEPGAPLFLVARDESEAGPPVAVVRHNADNFPVALSISDANVMLPGRSLAGLDRVRLIARVANSGDPVAKPGDLFGEAIWTGAADAPLDLLIDQVVTP